MDQDESGKSSKCDEGTLRSRHVRIAQVLLYTGVNVDQNRLKHDLHRVEEELDLDLIQFLIESSSDPSVITTCEQSLDLLQVAARCRNAKFAQFLLDRNYNIDALDIRGQSALRVAVDAHSCELVALLLENGANTEKDHPQIDLVMLAIGLGDRDVATYLIDSGVKFSNYNVLSLSIVSGLDLLTSRLLEQKERFAPEKGCLLVSRALHPAMVGGKIDILPLLLSHGADPNAIIYERKSALQIACSNLDTVATELLIEAGADIKATDHRGRGPLHFAASSSLGQCSDRVGFIDLLISRGAEVNLLTIEGDSPLYTALAHKNAWMAMKLIANGADTSPTRADRQTALHVAVNRNLPEVVQCLLESKVEVNPGDDRGWTPLHCASARHYADIVAMLISAGGDVTAKTHSGDQPLHKALRHEIFQSGILEVCSGSRGERVLSVEKIVKRLLDAGADVTARGALEMTALHHAAASSVGGSDAPVKEICRGRVIQMLIDAGASLDAVDQLGDDPIRFAVGKGQKEAVMLLLDHHDDIENTKYTRYLHKACMYGRKNIIHMLLHSGADVNVADEPYGTALQLACINAKEEIALMLLEYGANVNLRAGDHETALQAACCSGSEKIVRQLLERGADVHISGGKHGNALSTACIRGYEPLVRLLLDNGALVNERDDKGHAPIHLALHRHRANIVLLLTERGADLTMVDGFGRSALDWIALDKELLGQMGSIEQFETPETVRLETLEATVRRTVATILQAQEKYNPSDFYSLGRCLMFLNRFEDAQIAHEYVVTGTEADGTLEHNANCDGCDVYPIKGHRFVCKSCPEYDLCENCMETYHERSSASDCTGHHFMNISDMDWCGGKVQKGCPLLTKTRDWLQGMLDVPVASGNVGPGISEKAAEILDESRLRALTLLDEPRHS